MAETVTAAPLTLKSQREAMRDSKILGWECTQCKLRSITPMTRCRSCHNPSTRIAEFATQGEVVTYTIQRVAAEEFLNEVPFAWVIVELDGGPRVSGWVPFVTRPEDLPMGQRVKFVSSYKPGMQFEKV